MCGITGWVDYNQELSMKKNVLAAMVKTLEKRGPDAEGFYMTKHAAFGHRRLSVVDIERGAQPMVRQRGKEKYVITYNGELYNTPELRQQLTALGYSFATTCDTEVLLTAFIEWGPACVERFNGIFAFAILDEAKEIVFFARDRMGVKPLFYSLQGSSLIFASELKAMLAHPVIKPYISEEGLAEIFMIGPARTPGHGIFKNVQELKPGYMMLFSRKGLEIKQYWNLQSLPHTDDFDTTAGRVRELLYDAVQRQLVADVPICTLLSGGLDSSILTAYAAESYKQQAECVHTYSVDYVDDEKYFKADAFQPDADRPWIKKVVDYCETCHHPVQLEAGQLAHTLDEATFARDLPGMADVDTSLYLFCREIRKGATVAISGECADEVFGGYPWFYRQDMIKAQSFPWANSVQMRTNLLAAEIYHKIKPESYVQNRYVEAISEVPRLKGEDAVSARMREIFYLSLTRFMPTLLDRKDRMSMAFGLEVRVPFCDHRLVEYVWNIPWDMKNYQQREKGLLRRALQGDLPEDVLWRKKSPYPKTHNPLFYMTVRDKLLAVLADASSPLRDLIDIQKIKELAAMTQTSIPWFGQLMSTPQLFAYLLQVDTWFRQYKVQVI